VNATVTTKSVGVRTLAINGTVAVVGSVLVNAALLAVVLATDLVPPFMALSYPPVVFLSAVGAVGATLVYGVLARRGGNYDRTFRRVAVAVLVLSFIPDIGILVGDPAATLPAVLVLMVMHVTVAAVCIGVLTRT
jgi:hypothetical protein